MAIKDSRKQVQKVFERNTIHWASTDFWICVSIPYIQQLT